MATENGDVIYTRADIETGLSRSGVVCGVTIAAGALAGGGLVALGGFGTVSALTVPVLAAVLVQVAVVLAIVNPEFARTGPPSLEAMIGR